jgi:hypothetical protein
MTQMDAECRLLNEFAFQSLLINRVQNPMEGEPPREPIIYGSAGALPSQAATITA